MRLIIKGTNISEIGREQYNVRRKQASYPETLHYKPAFFSLAIIFLAWSAFPLLSAVSNSCSLPIA